MGLGFTISAGGHTQYGACHREIPGLIPDLRKISAFFINIFQNYHDILNILELYLHYGVDEPFKRFSKSDQLFYFVVVILEE